MVREHMARTLGVPLEKMRVVSRYVGGGFGSKINMKAYHVIAAEASRHLGRPVRLFMSRREEFIASHQRAPTRRRIRLGATRNGRLCLIDESITGQAGPSNFFARNAAGAANGLRLHKADAIRAELRRVLTNTQAPMPFRGPTAAEDIFCLEQAVDELAHALGMDPLELRRRNIGDTTRLQSFPMRARSWGVATIVVPRHLDGRGGRPDRFGTATSRGGQELAQRRMTARCTKRAGQRSTAFLTAGSRFVSASRKSAAAQTPFSPR